jgi:biopolymer transport protein ExbB
MTIDTAFFHEVCLNILYACIGILTFVIIERIAYFAILSTRLHGLDGMRKIPAGAMPPPISRNDVLSRALREYIAAQTIATATRASAEDVSMDLVMRVGERIRARIWLLDMIVTAAPLLGLLGTILGIMDTFNALSSGGISDPAAVSRGIAAALIATAVGIFTALFGLLGHNLLNRQAEAIETGFKGLLLVTTRSDLAAAPTRGL